MKKICLIVVSFCFLLSASAQQKPAANAELALKKEYQDVSHAAWYNFEKSNKYFAIQPLDVSSAKIHAFTSDGLTLYVGNIVSFTSISQTAQVFLKERFIGDNSAEAKYILDKTFTTTLDNQSVEVAMLKFKDADKYLILYFDASGVLIKREILE